MSVTIGQKLYEPRERSAEMYIEHTVASIGRKWVNFTNGRRCTIDTLMLDCGGYSPRKLYTDIEQHKADRRLSAAWADLRRDIGNIYSAPEGMTVETINEVRRTLGLQVLPDPSQIKEGK